MSKLVIPVGDIPPAPSAKPPHTSLMLRNLTLVEAAARGARECIAQADVLVKADKPNAGVVTHAGEERRDPTDAIIESSMAQAGAHLQNLMTAAGMIHAMIQAGKPAAKP